MTQFVGALDQGTTSTRFMIFDHAGQVVARHQLEHDQLLPRPGWVEHDPAQLWQRTQQVIDAALDAAGLSAGDLAAIGLTNQRETTVLWNPRTGQPYGNAIVWQDTRTDQLIRRLTDGGAAEVIRAKTGLMAAPYFSGGKIAWLLEYGSGLRAAADRGEVLFGTVDCWLTWNLTGRHLTDVTNASRTMLMNLDTLDWDQELLDIFGIPRSILPRIVSSSDAEEFGVLRRTTARGVPLTAVLGDQHAAMVGQVCFAPGEAKNTYGTGNFLLVNTGTAPVRSDSGLLTTLCYRFGAEAAVYALEGSIAVTGSAIQWLRDQLGIIDDASEIEALARSVPDTGGVYFVPAFSGLFAPYWRSDARGVIVGLSRFSTKAHLARAALEAICFQSADVAEAMGQPLRVLKVDGGVTANELCMQLQADILGVEVSRPSVAETTALGAAYAAGLAVGYWADTDELRTHWRESKRWTPQWTEQQRQAARARWKMAVERSLSWVDV